LAGLQQGASPFTMPQMARGIGLDAGAGQAATQFAGNVFGTQAGMWSTAAKLPSGFERFAGAAANLGKAAGGFGSAFGGGATKATPGG
jgi:hypothetical protein